MIPTKKIQKKKTQQLDPSTNGQLNNLQTPQLAPAWTNLNLAGHPKATRLQGS